MSTDLQDADFGFLESDQLAIRSGFANLIAAGFRPHARWRRNDGSTSEWSLVRAGIRFDFFEYRERGDCLEVSGYFPARSNWDDWQDSSGEEILQSRLLLPQQRLVAFELLQRTWFKHEDHALELDALYGESWRAPEKQFYAARGWSTGRDSPSVAERTVWRRSITSWDGSVVNGHRFLPIRGHLFSPLMAMFSPRWWPRISPPSGVVERGFQVRGVTPLPAVAWASR